MSNCQIKNRLSNRELSNKEPFTLFLSNLVLFKLTRCIRHAWMQLHIHQTDNRKKIRPSVSVPDQRLGLKWINDRNFFGLSVPVVGQKLRPVLRTKTGFFYRSVILACIYTCIGLFLHSCNWRGEERSNRCIYLYIANRS